MKESVRWIGLVVFIVVCLGAGGLGAIATTPEIEGWYQTIDKPSWNPPDYVFGPVWTTLFVMMAVAAWMVWKPEGFQPAAMPLTLFAIQLALNVAWSWIFFGMHQPGWALVEIVVLWLAIVATTVAFFRCSKLAGWLMVPYLAWESERLGLAQRAGTPLSGHSLLECGRGEEEFQPWSLAGIADSPVHSAPCVPGRFLRHLPSRWKRQS